MLQENEESDKSVVICEKERRKEEFRIQKTEEKRREEIEQKVTKKTKTRKEWAKTIHLIRLRRSGGCHPTRVSGRKKVCPNIKTRETTQKKYRTLLIYP